MKDQNDSVPGTSRLDNLQEYIKSITYVGYAIAAIAILGIIGYFALNWYIGSGYKLPDTGTVDIVMIGIAPIIVMLLASVFLGGLAVSVALIAYSTQMLIKPQNNEESRVAKKGLILGGVGLLVFIAIALRYVGVWH